MKLLTIAIAAFALAGGAAQAADSMSAGSTPVCLQVNQIKSTTSPDSKTILFTMIDGKVWKNSLPNPCMGLNFNGFAYVAANNQVCGNMQTIRVIQNGNRCMLGPFTPYTPPPKPAAQ